MDVDEDEAAGNDDGCDHVIPGKSTILLVYYCSFVKMERKWDFITVLSVKKIIYKNCRINSSFASNKVFIRWWPWVQAWFRSRSIITTNPGRPSSISQYYQTLLDGV